MASLPDVTFGDELKISSWVYAVKDVRKTQKWRLTSYQGMTWDAGTGSIMYGYSHRQKSRPHLLQVTGSLADVVTPSLVAVCIAVNKAHLHGEGLAVNCSRIDVKVDIPTKRRFNAAAMKRLVKAGYASGKHSGRCPVMEVYSSDSGDTLYVGAKSSEKRARVYQKESAWRYEIQARNGNVRYAGGAFLHLLNGGDAGDVFDALRWEWFPSAGSAGDFRAVTKPDSDGTERWLLGQVRQAIGKMGESWRRSYVNVLIADIESDFPDS